MRRQAKARSSSRSSRCSAHTPRRRSSELAVAGVTLLAALAIAAPAQAQPADARASATRTVRLKDSFFSPSRVELRRGDGVRFVWAGERRHNLVGPGIPARYETPARRHRPFTRVFRRAGRLGFLCSIHPGMEMTVRVR